MSSSRRVWELLYQAAGTDVVAVVRIISGIERCTAHLSWMSLLSFCQVASPLQAMMSNPSSSWRPLQMSKRISGRLDSINFLFPCCTCCKSRCTEVHFLFSWHNQTLSSHSIVFNSILIEYLNRICYIFALFLVTLPSSSFQMNEGNPMTAQHCLLVQHFDASHDKRVT